MNTQCKSNKVTNYQPAEKLLKRFMNKINVEKYEGPCLPIRVANSLIESNKRFEAERYYTFIIAFHFSYSRFNVGLLFLYSEYE